MTQNPYAQFGQPGGEFLEPVESRTSVLAILALISGLICCLPGPGILALVFGGAAVLVISRSAGRLRGMGMAITGIVLGLLFTIIWVMVLTGAVSIGQAFTQRVLAPVGSAVANLEKGDRSAIRGLLTPGAAAVATDQEIDEFARRLDAEWGAYQGTSASLWDMVNDYMKIGPRMQVFQGRNDMIPAPVHFQKGTTIVALQVVQGQSSGSQPGTKYDIPVRNLGFIAKDGSLVWLIPPDKVPTASVPAAPSPSDKDANESQPTPDPPEVPEDPEP